MDNLDLRMTLLAYKHGSPVPKGDTLRVDVANKKNTLLMAFVRMGGESTPWGIVIKKPGSDSKFFSVPDPRKRTELSLMLRQFWAHLKHQLELFKSLNGSDHFQLWLPNNSHLDMFHYLALRYIYTKHEPEGPEFKGIASDLRALARFSNWVFQESQRPGQTTIVLATQALKESFFFPADQLRQAHLGFLLSWLRKDIGKNERFHLAEEAEKESISATMAPEVEANFLEKPVSTYGSRDASPSVKQSASTNIAQTLRSQVENRIALVEQAYNLLLSDERDFNFGLNELRKVSKEEFYYNYTRVEALIAEGGNPFVKGVETDNSYKVAVRAYMEKEEANSMASNVLLPFDSYLKQKAISAGDAIEGKLLRIEKSKSGRAISITWVVQGSDINPLRIREGSKVYLSNFPKSSLTLDEIKPADGTRIYRMSVISPKTPKGGFDMTSKTLQGQKVLLITKPYTGAKWGKVKVINKSDLPGDWLLKRVSGK